MASLPMESTETLHNNSAQTKLEEIDELYKESKKEVDSKTRRRTSKEFTNKFLSYIGLSQAQVSTLLGLTPQAISKGLNHEGIHFFSSSKVQKLHNTLETIGTKKYIATANRLKEISNHLSLSEIKHTKNNHPSTKEFYLSSNELWILSNAPEKIIDLTEFSSTFFFSDENKRAVFLMSSLEHADRWAGIIESILISPAINTETGEINETLGRKLSSQIHIIVHNTMPYGSDFIIKDPNNNLREYSLDSEYGYIWDGSMYIRKPEKEQAFIQLTKSLGIGVDNNFFPNGKNINDSTLAFRNNFSDKLIGIRGGKNNNKIQSNFINGAPMPLVYAGGPIMVAAMAAAAVGGGSLGATVKGFLSNVVGTVLAGGISTGDNTSISDKEKNLAEEFSEKSKFIPVFISTYRRNSGDSFNHDKNKITKHIKNEYEFIKKNNNNSNEDFWE